MLILQQMGANVGGLDDQALETFVELAKIDHQYAGGRVFSVGPYGNRVAFAYQQARAFALAAGFPLWLKRQRAELKPGEISIAILGGGVAGITLMAALHCLGFTRLKLFERKAEVLMDQAYASHRLIHPSYNIWPIAEEYASTTRFPFLNWFAGPCDKVIAALTREWKRDWVDRFAADAIQFGCVVESVSFDKEESKVRISCQPNRTNSQTDHYCDYAFATLGYGVEKSTRLSEQTSGRYWYMDTIQPTVADHEKKRLLCVGDGDGALIDCARLAYRGDVFEIATELMGFLSSDKNRPKDLFDWKRSKTDIEEKICTAETRAVQSMSSADDVIIELKGFYLELVRRLSLQALAILNRGIIEKSGFFVDREIHLVGRSVAPFLPGTAPINKLIMAHLITKGLVTYHKGELIGLENTAQQGLKAGIDCPNFNDFDYRVIRIGSEPPIEKFFDNIREKYTTAIAGIIKDFRPDFIDTSRFYNESTVESQQRMIPGSCLNMKHKEKHVRKFLETYCRNSDGHNADSPIFREEGTNGVIIVPNHEVLSYAAKKLGGYDWHVFGIPLKSENVNRERYEAILGSGFQRG